MQAYFSPALRKLKWLSRFFDEPLIYRPSLKAKGIAAVLVMGAEEDRPALDFALERGLPIWRVFCNAPLSALPLWRFGLKSRAPLWSVAVDRTGAYYDAGAPSDLETLLNSDGWETPEILAQAENFLTRLTAAGKSDAMEVKSHRRVLVIDQSRDDPSITRSLAGPEIFTAMLAAARAENPEAEIFVLKPADVIGGQARGCLPPSLLTGLKILGPETADGFAADEVYTVSSEAALPHLWRGRAVHCFGLPFYAGWGLTRDRQTCPRRGRQLSLAKFFAGAFMVYPRYVNPVTGRRADFAATLRLLEMQERRGRENVGHWAAYGFPPRKRAYIRAFLGEPQSEVRFYDKLQKAEARAERPGGRLLAWNSKLSDEDEVFLSGRPVVRLEDAFLRSVGLGQERVYAPYSLAADPVGFYYDPTRPSRLENILAGYDFKADPELLERAEKLRRDLVEKNLSKYNVGGRDLKLEGAEGKKVILVPGQVENDASLRKGGSFVRLNLDLLATVRRRNPEAYIIYKPHPDVEKLDRAGLIPEDDLKRLADLTARELHISALWPHVDEVHCMTSLVGFEALWRGLQTHTYGGPFYAGWGLTHDVMTFPRRRPLELNALLAGAFILYPTYFDWASRLFCDPEDVIELLADASAEKRRPVSALARLRERLAGFRLFR